MRFPILIAAVLFITADLPVKSQPHVNNRIIEEIIEELILDDILRGDVTVIYDELLYYIENPVDINSAGREELANLYFLNELQITNLLEYRKRYGGLTTLYEIQYIDGFTQDDIRKILPFISIDDARPFVEYTPAGVLRYGRHQLFLRFQQVLQEQKGYSPISDSALSLSPGSRYLGSPLKIYNRYQFNYRNKVQAGYVAEKDAGEEFFRGSNPHGFDYNSFHLQINDLGRVKKLVTGDYQAGFGQGLVLWSGLAFGKSAAVLNVRKNQRGLGKYSSTDENMFFRGAGITYGVSSNTEMSLFFSRKKIDAVASLKDEDGKVREVSSLPSTGLHATPSQMESKNLLGETIIGGNISFNHSLFRVGSTFMMMEYDAVLNPPERVYNSFDFRGKRNQVGGLDYQFGTGPVRFFGEGAVSSSRGAAFLGGALANLSSKMSISALYRNYARDYHSYFSNAFRENTRTVNEKGFYLGTEIHPLRKWKFSAYFDIFSFPWMKYGAWAPSSGAEYFMQVDFSYSRELNMYLSFRHKSKPVNSPSGEGNVRYLLDAGTTRLRYHVNYFVSSSLELRNRLELSGFSREDISPERGILLYQDLLYRPQKIPFSIAFRYAVFETDTYNARLYAYENDVLYAFSIPAYYDRGFRTYLLVQYTGLDFADFWVRYAITRLPGRESIGSGLNEIKGNNRSELKVQVRMRF